MIPKIYCVIPTYGGTMQDHCLNSLLRASSVERNLMKKYCIQGYSSTTHNFNRLYCNALNLRKSDRITHFAMLHSDIAPENLWIDKLWDLMEKKNADIISAVVPLKCPRGITSTAIDEPIGDSDPYWRPRRLTMHEIMEMDPTFTHEKLLVNTGCMLIDITKPFAEKISFKYHDEIVQNADGKFEALFAPEDWLMSRVARENGAKIYATREVKLHHYGNGQWGNYQAWGSAQTDALE